MSRNAASITCIYLAVVLDLYSRCVVGRSLQSRQTADVVSLALYGGRKSKVAPRAPTRSAGFLAFPMRRATRNHVESVQG